MELLIASKNTGKIREFREILHSILGLDINSLLAFPNYNPPEETGTTFDENATLKAVQAAKELGLLTLSDDSGLIVPALDNRPGVHSRRFAGPEATDHENCLKLLRELEGKTGLERQAYFECVLVLATPEKVIKTVSARVEGYIIEEEKGRSGFGYDSIFMKHDYDKTFSELSEDVKNRVSHRRKALDLITPTLEHLVHEATLKNS